MNSTAKGKIFEKIALNYLVKKKDMKLVSSNYFTKFGEIDLIMSLNDDDNNNFIVFVEVKGRKYASDFDIFSSLTLSKRKKIKASIDYWLFSNNKENTTWRFDFIGIEVRKKEYNILHFEYVYL